MLVLRQTDKPPAKNNELEPYSLGRLQNQVRSKIENVGDRKEKVKWVCFVTKERKFVAYQSYQIFFVNLCRADKQQYEEILNTRDIDDFKKAIDAHKKIEGLSSGAIDFRFLIPGLHLTAVKEGPTKEALLAYLLEKKMSHVMLVSDPDEKPVGIVSLGSLIDDILLKNTTTRERRQELLALVHAVEPAAAASPPTTSNPQPPPAPEEQSAPIEYDSEDGPLPALQINPDSIPHPAPDMHGPAQLH